MTTEPIIEIQKEAEYEALLSRLEALNNLDNETQANKSKLTNIDLIEMSKELSNLGI